MNNAEPQKTGAKSEGGGNKFHDILRQMTSNPSQSAQGAATLPPVQHTPFIPFDTISHISASENIAQVEQFLNIIESYHAHMEDHGSTLKDCYPLVSDMEQATSGILPLLDSLSDGDGLKDILNRAAVTATVEAIKFNRGDYL